MIRRYSASLILLTIAILLIWLLNTSDALSFGLPSGLLLLLLGCLMGLRWGADSSDRLIKELHQLNKYLAEQNSELSQLNHFHLKQLLPTEDRDPNMIDPTIEPRNPRATSKPK